MALSCVSSPLEGDWADYAVAERTWKVGDTNGRGGVGGLLAGLSEMAFDFVQGPSLGGKVTGRDEAREGFYL